VIVGAVSGAALGIDVNKGRSPVHHESAHW
jgi:hypothetical protein